MPELRTQLLSYGDYLEEVAPEISTEEVEALVGPIVLDTPRTVRRRRVLVALAAAALVLLLVGGTAVLVRLLRVEQPPVITEPAPSITTTPSLDTTSIPSPTTTLSVTSVSEAVPPGWKQIPTEGEVFGGETIGAGIDKLVVWEAGVWAFGVTHDPTEVAEQCDRDGSCPEGVVKPTIWTSPDGTTWSRHDGADLRNSPEPILDRGQVKPGGPGLIYAQGPVFISSDGVSWTANSPGGFAHDVIEGGPGLIAVGAAEVDFPEDPCCQAAVWVSETGDAWTQIVPDFGGRFLVDVDIRSVTAGGPGYVAVGTDNQSGNPTWTSPDGLTWTRGSDLPEPTPATIVRKKVLAVGSQVVVVGEAGEVWTSADGVSWTFRHERNLGLPDDQGPSCVQDVVVGGPGLTAWGCNWVWASADGVTWEPVPVPSRIRPVVPFAGGLIGARTIGSFPDEVLRVEIWVWTLPDD